MSARSGILSPMPPIHRLTLALTAGCLLLAAPAYAQTLPDLPAPVNDFAKVVDADSARTLDSRIRALRQATGDIVVIATVPTFAPYGSVDEYATALFAHAKLGRKGDDRGLLIVLAVKERKIRVEVGYGLESVITDGFSGETIRTLMAPEFRNGHFGAGLAAGTSHLIERIASERKVALEGSAPAAGGSDDGGSVVLGLVLIVMIAAVVLGVILLVIRAIAKATGGARATPVSDGGYLGSGSSSSSRQDDDSSSSGGESNYGSDGGSSGGGGASGSW